jgi:glycosyltransferase involved in cell wall biosynthesis
MRIDLVGFTIPGSGDSGIKGMDNYIYKLGANYVRMGHATKLFVRGGFAPRESWVKPVYAPRASWMAYPFFLAPRLLRESADVYHSDYITTGVSLAWARRKPCVVSIHDVIPFSHPALDDSAKTGLQSRWYFSCFSRIKRADALIVMSESSRKEALEFTDIEKGRLHVVHNGVDHDRFYPLPKKRHGKVRIGYLGGLDGRKNVRLLVESFRKISADRDDVELHVGGKGKSLDEFRSMKIPNAHFHGFVPDGRVNEFYNSLDVFVFPSLAEGFGNMAAEAMACGVPVVAVNRTSLPEVVGDAGILVEPDAGSMAAALNRLADSERLRLSLSRKSVKQAGTFTWERCAKETLKVYEGVTGR